MHVDKLIDIKKTALGIGLLFLLCCASCSNPFPSLSGLNAVQITTYNIQTFFDAVTTGLEYDDFKGSKSSWSEEKYKIRLARLCSMLEFLDSDIFVFQEIENEQILQDISNNLKIQADASRSFSYAVFVPSRDKTLGCAVLSRFPILSCSSHAVDIRRPAVSPPDMRPLLEVSVDCGFSFPVTVFAGHWKSKAGSDEHSGFWRSAQEAVLASRISLFPEGYFIFCGDCNKDISEFHCSGAYVVLNAGDTLTVKSELVHVISPWLVSPYSSLNGSYYYQKRWEKIDHFFLGTGLSLHAFKREDEGFHVNDQQIPVRYTVWNGEGYSDHLPLSCVFGEKK